MFIANYYFLAGKVRELRKGTEIPEATINVYDENGNLVQSVTSDADGGFKVYLPYDQDLSIKGEKDGYETIDVLPYSTRGKPFGVDSLYLPMWQHNMYAKGRVLSNETENALPGSTVILHNLTDKKADTLALNEASEYKFLVLPDKNYRVEASKEGYITKGYDLDTKGLYEGELLNDIILEEVYLEKDAVYFAFDRSSLSAQARKQLDRIIAELKSKSTTTVNIGAHADSRGTKEYNQKLSDRRADAVVKYMESKGIKRSRIEARGFGEEFLVNKCSDGVVCPETDHSKNRRAEVKIQNEPIN
jgi:outer membrane protein OmpA-like peptidoglycan-associated protein